MTEIPNLTSPKISFCVLLVFGLCATSLTAHTIGWTDVNRLNSTNGTTWSEDGSSSHALLVGDSSNNNNLFEIAVTFDISAFTAEIASGSTITLEFDYGTLLGTPYPIEAYGFGASSGNISSIGATSFHDAGMSGTSGGTVSSFASPPNSISYDVTTIVQSISGSQDFANFLLSANLSSNPGGSVADAVRFYEADTLGATGARLVVVPEPSTYALFVGLTCLLGVMVRRRR